VSAMSLIVGIGSVVTGRSAQKKGGGCNAAPSQVSVEP
jgi:hypothetical protein